MISWSFLFGREKVGSQGCFLQVLAYDNQDFLPKGNMLCDHVSGRCVDLEPFAVRQRQISFDTKDAAEILCFKYFRYGALQLLLRAFYVHEKQGGEGFLWIKPELFMIRANPSAGRNGRKIFVRQIIPGLTKYDGGLLGRIIIFSFAAREGKAPLAFEGFHDAI